MGKAVVSLAPKVWAITAPLRSYHVKMLTSPFSNFHRVEDHFYWWSQNFIFCMFQVKKPIEPRLYDGILFWETFLPGITISSQGKRIVVDRCNVTRLQRRVWLAVADDNKAPTAEAAELGADPPVRSGQHCLYLVGCARGLREKWWWSRFWG